MQEERKIKVPTTGVYDFPSLILGGKGKYIDKTDLLYRLANDADQQLFISRPRRFGKSLMLSTLKAMFEGRRELFKGLAIDSLPWEGWEQPTPVYSFTMSSATGVTYELFREQLAKLVKSLCAQAEVEYKGDGDVSGQFDDFLVAAAKKSPAGKIVVLIDEYDEPVANFLDDIPTLKKVRFVLHDFYEKLKVNSANIRFLMMTGVTKLTKLSVFSGMNHLTDISSFEQYATLLGYTPEELDGPLRENVEAFGARNGMDFAEAKRGILDWYDGYRFSPDSKARVCNPVSIGSAFKTGKLKGYWETTGRATLIINRIARAGKLPNDIEKVLARPIELDVCDAETLPMAALLYQGGYLTIKDELPPEVDESGMPVSEPTYVLAPPNFEVREALKRGYLSQVMGLREQPFNALVEEAKRHVAAGDWRNFILESLFRLYASVPPDWQIGDEAEAKRYFQLCAKAAIRQIRERGYADKWIGGERPVTLVGVNFNPKKRNIDLPVIEPA